MAGWTRCAAGHHCAARRRSATVGRCARWSRRLPRRAPAGVAWRVGPRSHLGAPGRGRLNAEHDHRGSFAPILSRVGAYRPGSNVGKPLGSSEQGDPLPAEVGAAGVRSVQRKCDKAARAMSLPVDGGPPPSRQCPPWAVAPWSAGCPNPRPTGVAGPRRLLTDGRMSHDLEGTIPGSRERVDRQTRSGQHRRGGAGRRRGRRRPRRRPGLGTGAAAPHRGHPASSARGDRG